MKMVVAYIRHEAFEPIRQDLLEAGFPSLSITEVKGSGRQKGITEHYTGLEIAIHLRPKIKIECVVEDNAVGVVTRRFSVTPAPDPSATARSSRFQSRTRFASAPARPVRRSAGPRR